MLDIPTIGIGKELLVVDGMDKDGMLKEESAGCGRRGSNVIVCDIY